MRARRGWLAVGVWAALVVVAHAGSAQGRFRTVDVYVETWDTPLAAYQVEITARDDSAKIVGVEGGEHPAYRSAPYYDPSALHRDRIVLGGLSTSSDLPTGRTRVASLHMYEPAGGTDYDVRLVVAGDAAGNSIAAGVSVETRKGRR